jgi:hypothetical protein
MRGRDITVALFAAGFVVLACGLAWVTPATHCEFSARSVESLLAPCVPHQTASNSRGLAAAN